MGREGPKWGREVLFPANKNLADILGRTDFDFENFYFLDFLGSQLGPGLGPAWAQLGPGLGRAWARAWARLGPGLGPAWARAWARLGPGLGRSNFISCLLQSTQYLRFLRSINVYHFKLCIRCASAEH